MKWQYTSVWCIYAYSIIKKDKNACLCHLLEVKVECLNVAFKFLQIWNQGCHYILLINISPPPQHVGVRKHIINRMHYYYYYYIIMIMTIITIPPQIVEISLNMYFLNPKVVTEAATSLLLL